MVNQMFNSTTVYNCFFQFLRTTVSQTTFNVEKQNKIAIKRFPIMFFEDIKAYRFLFFLEIDNALVFIINATSFYDVCGARARIDTAHDC